jgi:hypothetical protein
MRATRAFGTSGNRTSSPNGNHTESDWDPSFVPTPSQHWFPALPAQSRGVPGSGTMCLLSRTERDRMGPSEIRWDSMEPPRNAQVVGSSPTSGSNQKCWEGPILAPPILSSASCRNNLPKMFVLSRSSTRGRTPVDGVRRSNPFQAPAYRSIIRNRVRQAIQLDRNVLPGMDDAITVFTLGSLNLLGMRDSTADQVGGLRL